MLHYWRDSEREENDNIVIVHPPASYPGQNVRPSIERGAIESKEPLSGALNGELEINIAYAAIGEQVGSSH